MEQNELIQAMKKKSILSGRVVMVQPVIVAGQQSTAIVDFEGTRITIPKNEIILPGRATKLKSMVGSEIDFVITDIIEEAGMIIGSNKIAMEILRRPVVEKLQKNKTIEAVITNILPYGAWLQLSGVSMFIKNVDFSADGNRIMDISGIKVGMKIRVKRKERKASQLKDLEDSEMNESIETENGKIYVQAEKKYQSMCSLQFSDYAIGSVALGYVNNIYPGSCMIRIGKNIDVLSFLPDFAEIRVGDRVQVKITRIKEEKKELRGKIVNIL